MPVHKIWLQSFDERDDTPPPRLSASQQRPPCGRRHANHLYAVGELRAFGGARSRRWRDDDDLEATSRELRNKARHGDLRSADRRRIRGRIVRHHDDADPLLPYCELVTAQEPKEKPGERWEEREESGVVRVRGDDVEDHYGERAN